MNKFKVGDEVYMIREYFDDDLRSQYYGKLGIVLKVNYDTAYSRFVYTVLYKGFGQCKNWETSLILKNKITELLYV